MVQLARSPPRPLDFPSVSLLSTPSNSQLPFLTLACFYREESSQNIFNLER